MLSLKTKLGYLLRAGSNFHRPGGEKDIFLFATARGGSTWLMEILASQPGMKYYDEPLNIRRSNVQQTGLFREWHDLMPDGDRREDIINYLKALQSNQYRFMNPLPLRRNHRFVTNRIVFKIHGVEHLINDIKQECGGTVVFLLRHPIPTTLSRYTFPRLDQFLLSCHYEREYLDAAQVREIRRIYCLGDKLQHGVLSWCFENLVPLRFSDTTGWVTVTYEELLLNSEPACRLLAQRLNLPDVATLVAAVNRPAANIAMSGKDTHSILREPDEQNRKRSMVTKWKEKITDADERRCFDVLDLFMIDAYRPKRFVSHERYLHFHDTVNASGERLLDI